MPIYFEKVRIGPLRVNIARLVGAYNPARVFDVPVITEFAAEIGVDLVSQLVNTERCDLISIGPISDECESKEALFFEIGKMKNKFGIIREAPWDFYNYFDLPDIHEAYLRSVSKNERRNFK